MIRRDAALAALILVGTVHCAPASPPVDPSCASGVPGLESAVESAWTAWRGAQVQEADSMFQGVLARCPTHPGALVGVGYAALRHGEEKSAAGLFERALVSRPSDYDALTGLGLLAYRQGKLRASRRRFRAALDVVPGDSLSLWYLSRIPGGLDGVELPPPERPRQTVVAARAARRILEVPDDEGGWTPLWVKAVNLGAALPGKHPSEFPPDDGTYDAWIELVAEMNANAIRVYTIHPPHFYRALERWNADHPERPLWLIHGVWTELPPGPDEERYDDATWKGAFLDEMRRVVDLVHGRAVIAPRAGHASGIYAADISRWTLAYIIGREWEPYSVVAFARRHPTRTSFHGRYLSIEGGNAVDAWLAEVSDFMVGYEMDRYNAQRPLAYTSWSTLDPLTHLTESTLVQEDSIRRSRNEVVPEAPKEYDNDVIGLDASLVRATASYSAGVFASFHAYPYYPDFIVYDSAYSAARSPEGPSNYYGYLRALVDHFGDMPVVISEYGVPSSRGIAHVQPQGWNHGGHSEAEQAEINARLTRDIHAAGAAGAGLFALIDEWFKKNWVVIDFEHPPERNRLWLNPLDAEQNYGVIAMRPGRKDSSVVIDGAADDWRGRTGWYHGDVERGGLPAAGGRGPAEQLPAPLRLESFAVASDEAYVYLRLDVAEIDWRRGRYLIGIDTHDPVSGDAVLPYTATRSPVGLEFVVDLHGRDGSHLLVDEPYNLYRSPPIAGSVPPATQQVYNRPFRSMPNADGRYDSLIVVTNRRRIGRDGTVYPEIAHDRSLLLFARQQETTLADWYADPTTGTIELRIPWGMLYVTDPSSRLVLRGNARNGEIAAVATDGFRFVVQSFDPRDPARPGDRLPRETADSGFAKVPTWTWPTWEEPRWYAERKPQFEAMRRTFEAIRAGTGEGHGSPPRGGSGKR
jgi:hypothetical protein